MAKEVVIKARLDTQDSVSKVEQLRKSIADISKENPGVALEQLNKAVDSGKLSISEVKKAIREYQSIALEAGQTSPIGQEALMRAGSLTDKLSDMRNQVKAMALDGKAMNAAMTISNTALQGYTAFIGLTQLAGGENKKLIETMAKMQIIMQTLNAVEQIANQFRKGSILTTYAMNVAYKMLGIEITTATAATRGFTAALVATGIGAIIVAIGLLIANFKEISNWLKKITFGFEDNTEAVKANSEALLQNTKIATENLEREYARRIKILRAHGKDTLEVERELLLEKEKLLKRELALYVAQTRTLVVLGKLSIDEMRERTAKIRELLNNYKDVITDIQVLEIESRKKIKEAVAEIEKEVDRKSKISIDFELKPITASKVEASEFISLVDTISLKQQQTVEQSRSMMDVMLAYQGTVVNTFIENKNQIAREVEELNDILISSSLKTVGAIGSVFDSLASMQKRGSEQYKKLALAGIIASQAESIANAVVIATKSARDAMAIDPTGVARIAIYISTFASITASILASISKAKQILGESASVTTGISGGGGVHASQTVLPEQQTGYKVGENKDTEPIKVVVLESDITQVQNSVRYINKISAI